MLNVTSVTMFNQRRERKGNEWVGKNSMGIKVRPSKGSLDGRFIATSWGVSFELSKCARKSRNGEVREVIDIVALKSLKKDAWEDKDVETWKKIVDNAKSYLSKCLNDMTYETFKAKFDEAMDEAIRKANTVESLEKAAKRVEKSKESNEAKAEEIAKALAEAKAKEEAKARKSA